MLFRSQVQLLLDAPVRFHRRHVHVLQRLAVPQSWARGQSFSFKPLLHLLPRCLCCLAAWRARSQLPGQGLNSQPLHQKAERNHWTTSKSPETTFVYTSIKALRHSSEMNNVMSTLSPFFEKAIRFWTTPPIFEYFVIVYKLAF